MECEWFNGIKELAAFCAFFKIWVFLDNSVNFCFKKIQEGIIQKDKTVEMSVGFLLNCQKRLNLVNSINSVN